MASLALDLEQQPLLEKLLQQEQALAKLLPPKQRELWKGWNERLAGDNAVRAMLSIAYRVGDIHISDEDAAKNDSNWDRIVTEYMLEEVEDYRKENPSHDRLRTSHEQRFAKFGAGTGLGVGYIDKLAEILTPEIYDWSASALKNTADRLASVITEHGLDEDSTFRIGEGVRVATNLDENVVFVEETRFDEHFVSDAAAAAFFQGLGGVLKNPAHRVIAIGARKGEQNSQSRTDTCKHRDKDFPLVHLSKGAGRQVRQYRHEIHSDAEKKVFDFQTFR